MPGKYQKLIWLFTDANLVLFVQDIKLSNEEQEIYAAFMSKKTTDKTCMARMRDTLFEQHEEIKTQIDEESKLDANYVMRGSPCCLGIKYHESCFAILWTIVLLIFA